MLVARWIGPNPFDIMIQQRLDELGITLPEAVKPLASYIPAKKAGELLFISGQLPMKEGALMMTGPMTNERNLEEAQNAIAQCFINGLAAATLETDLDNIVEVVRLAAFVASVPEFTNHHLVANGASNLAQEILGDAGIHARAAIGVPSLPINSTVELEIVFRIKA